MGLDQMAYRTRDPLCQGAFLLPDPAPESEEIARWRKHSDLHGWMRKLFREKASAELREKVPPTDDGGTFMGEGFNAGEGVELTSVDLDRLEEALVNRKLPTTRGFFFGESDCEEELPTDLYFVNQARKAISEGWRIYYTSWW